MMINLFQSQHDNNQVAAGQSSFFNRLKQGLSRTRAELGDRISRLLLGKKTIDKDLLAELERILLTADIGVSTTTQILKHLTDALSRKTLRDPAELKQELVGCLTQMLQPYQQPLQLADRPEQPQVILMVGINGVGKTTTVAKLSQQIKASGKKVMLAAADTFRAAAIEQLRAWGEQQQMTVIHQQHGADSAAVAYDAHQSAIAKKADVLIVDTAGRLHTQTNLMNELAKIKRILAKQDAKAPHEILLVLDATSGQNALHQAKQFHQVLGVTGLVISKLDGSAKGGMVFAISQHLHLPIRFVGVGEQADDLKPFIAADFVSALFADA